MIRREPRPVHAPTSPMYQSSNSRRWFEVKPRTGIIRFFQSINPLIRGGDSKLFLAPFIAFQRCINPLIRGGDSKSFGISGMVMMFWYQSSNSRRWFEVLKSCHNSRRTKSINPLIRGGDSKSPEGRYLDNDFPSINPLIRGGDSKAGTRIYWSTRCIVSIL